MVDGGKHDVGSQQCPNLLYKALPDTDTVHNSVTVPIPINASVYEKSISMIMLIDSKSLVSVGSMASINNYFQDSQYLPDGKLRSSKPEFQVFRMSANTICSQGMKVDVSEASVSH